MAVTDLVVHNGDGAVYFAVGGRKTLSALYRLRYSGKESTAPAKIDEPAEVLAARKLRRELEAFHTQRRKQPLLPLWPNSAIRTGLHDLQLASLWSICPLRSGAKPR